MERDVIILWNWTGLLISLVLFMGCKTNIEKLQLHPPPIGHISHYLCASGENTHDDMVSNDRWSKYMNKYTCSMHTKTMKRVGEWYE